MLIEHKQNYTVKKVAINQNDYLDDDNKEQRS